MNNILYQIVIPVFGTILAAHNIESHLALQEEWVYISATLLCIDAEPETEHYLSDMFHDVQIDQ